MRVFLSKLYPRKLMLFSVATCCTENGAISPAIG